MLLPRETSRALCEAAASYSLMGVSEKEEGQKKQNKTKKNKQKQE